MSTSEHTKEHHPHVQPTSVYVKTLMALFCLMALTVWAGVQNLPDIGPLSGTVVNQLVALIIAVTKAFLVITIFMGAKFGTKLIKMWATIGFVWFLFLFGILADFTTRKYEIVNGAWAPESGLQRIAPPNPKMPPANDLNVKIRE